jgi:hypothetical protein
MQAKTRLEPATLQPHLPSHPLASSARLVSRPSRRPLRGGLTAGPDRRGRPRTSGARRLPRNVALSHQRK